MIVNARRGEPICLGYETENDVEAVVFDKTAWIEAYGPGTFEFVHKRRQDSEALPVAVDVSGGVVTWTITAADVAYRGAGEAQLRYYNAAGQIKASEIYRTQVSRSLVSDPDVPSPLEGWVEEVLKAAAGIQNMQAEAETLTPGSAATVTKTVDPDTGVVTLTFGIPEGVKGDTGRGVASMSVLSTGEWRVVYTDGTSETVGYDVYSALDALKTAAQQAKTDAETAKTDAETAARNAEHDADRAEQGAEDAQAAKTDAQQAKTDAETAKTDAETAARNAEQDADRAEQGAEDAQAANTAAQQAKTDAETAKTDAETAARNAEEWASQVDPENLAHIDGSYPDMTVGNAEQLVSTLFVEDTEPYTFRKAGGSHDIGNREYDEIVGGSLAWNQLIPPTKATATVAGITYTNNGDGSWTLNGTATGQTRYVFLSQYIQNSHVLLFAGWNGDSSLGEFLGTYYGSVRQPTLTTPSVFKFSGDVNEFSFRARTNAVFDNVIVKPQIIDLTLMFGSTIADYIYSLEQANAGAGVAWVRRYLPKDYYSYNPGSMESVQVSAHRMVGFNAYNPATGTAKVLGGMQYQITGAYTALTIDGAAITPDADGIFTPSKNGTLTVTGGDSTTTCVHLVHSGYRNGEYEPYVEHIYPLDDSLTLRGIPTLDGDKLKFDGDIYSADGTVTRRYGIIDLGTFNWAYNSNIQAFASGGLIGQIRNGQALICTRYPITPSLTTSVLNAVDKVIACNKAPTATSGYVGVDRIVVKDTAYTDAESFKAAMSGVMLVYELATPTTETAEPFQSPQIVDDFGTEEYVDAGLAAETRDFAFPVGHDTKYPPNLRDKLQKLPSVAADDGRYVIQQTDGNMALVPDTSPGQIAALAVKVPDPPTADGMYRLTVTMTDGIPAYSWVSE